MSVEVELTLNDYRNILNWFELAFAKNKKQNENDTNTFKKILAGTIFCLLHESIFVSMYTRINRGRSSSYARFLVRVATVFLVRPEGSSIQYHHEMADSFFVSIVGTNLP